MDRPSNKRCKNLEIKVKYATKKGKTKLAEPVGIGPDLTSMLNSINQRYEQLAREVQEQAVTPRILPISSS